jgi:hypothetical protein
MGRPKKTTMDHTKIRPESQHKLTREEKDAIREIKKEMREWNKYPEELKRNYHLKHLLEQNKYKRIILKYIKKNSKLLYTLGEIERVCGIRRN